MIKVTELWRISPKKEDTPIYSVAFKPDGSLVAATQGKSVKIHDTHHGSLLHKLKGHKATVNTLAWSNDGSLLASGGADKTTILWNEEGKGILKLNHDTSVQAVAFNPQTNQLSSCACNDFGLWSSSTNTVCKYKVVSKILDCAWSQDGLFLALAHEFGYVQIFDNKLNKFIAKVGTGDAPVCCLDWVPTTGELAFGTKNLISFYDKNTNKIVNDIDLGFLACSINYSGPLRVIAGSSGYSLELSNTTGENYWIWSACCNQDGSKIALGTNAGSIVMQSIDYDDKLLVEIYMRQHRWDEARQLIEDTGCLETHIITKRKAEWTMKQGDVDSAATVYIESGDHLSAIQLLFDQKYPGWENSILQIIKKAKCSQDVLSAAEAAFSQAGYHQYLADLYRMTNDSQKLLQVHLDTRNWTDANAVIDELKDPNQQSKLRAQLLVMQGNFREAFRLYCVGGHLEMAKKLTLELANSAALMNEYKDASHHLWLLAMALCTSQSDEASDLMRRSESYYLFHIVHQSCTEPFVHIDQETLLNAAALLYNAVSQVSYRCIGISLPTVLSVLKNTSSSLDAHCLTKMCFCQPKEQQSLCLNDEAAALDVPTRDKSDLLPVCYKCGHTNELIRKVSYDRCLNCGHLFLRCFLNLDVLPLVEFIPSDEITSDEAIDLIRNQDISNESNLLFDEYIQKSLQNLHTEGDKANPKPMVVHTNVLAALSREEIFVVRAKSSQGKDRFFKNVLSEIGVALCPECHHFFHEADFEFAVLRDGGCPFCRCDIMGKNYGHI